MHGSRSDREPWEVHCETVPIQEERKKKSRKDATLTMRCLKSSRILVDRRDTSHSQWLLTVSECCKERCRVGMSGCQGCVLTYLTGEGWVGDSPLGETRWSGMRECGEVERGKDLGDRWNREDVKSRSKSQSCVWRADLASPGSMKKKKRSSWTRHRAKKMTRKEKQ